MKMIVEKGWFIPTLQFGPDDVFLFEDWEDTPAGPYRAVFHFTPRDFRTLYVNNAEGGDLVSSIHRFDEKHVVDVKSQRRDGRWTIEADTGDKGNLRIEIEFRETPMLKAVNPIACRVPEVLARNPLYCRMLPRLAGPLLGIDPNQKITGITEMGRKGRFRLDRIFKVTGGRCTWGGKDLGPLTDCSFQHDMGDFRLTSKAVVSYLSLFVE